MIYKQVFIPDEDHHSIEMPVEFFGKKVEVIVVEIGNAAAVTQPFLPAGKRVPLTELFESFGKAPDFPSVDELRAKAWPSKW